MAENPVKEKSFRFAVRVVRLCKFLTEEKREFVISRQILRSGTSIGANVKEALQAESKADFIHKLSISLKEASETEYWLQLLKETEYIDPAAYDSMMSDCIELLKLLTSIIKSSKQAKTV
ncbi:MAG TPA: four helix bundle protein [Blastocatellia bacterium]|nr:four helix bundle protein [Blastocatellia bacterium]